MAIAVNFDGFILYKAEKKEFRRILVTNDTQNIDCFVSDGKYIYAYLKEDRMLEKIDIYTGKILSKVKTVTGGTIKIYFLWNKYIILSHILYYENEIYDIDLNPKKTVYAAKDQTSKYYFGVWKEISAYEAIYYDSCSNCIYIFSKNELEISDYLIVDSNLSNDEWSNIHVDLLSKEGEVYGCTRFDLKKYIYYLINKGK